MDSLLEDTEVDISSPNKEQERRNKADERKKRGDKEGQKKSEGEQDGGKEVKRRSRRRGRASPKWLLSCLKIGH